MKKRFDLVDSLKGIGMISIIIGHSVSILPITCLKIGCFVYLYHIMLFFFSTGFLYDERNNSDIRFLYRQDVLGSIQTICFF